MAQPIADPVTPEQAAAIMSSNFIDVGVLQRHFGATMLSSKFKELFGQVPFSAEVLKQHASTHVLVACGALSLINVWKIKNNLFYHKTNLLELGTRFATTRASAGWQLVRKTQVSESLYKSRSEQRALLGACETVPSALVLAQAILLTYLKTGERLFEDTYVRTSDVDSCGNCVLLGHFDKGGLEVRCSWGGYRYDNLGLASSRERG